MQEEAATEQNDRILSNESERQRGQQSADPSAPQDFGAYIPGAHKDNRGKMSVESILLRRDVVELANVITRDLVWPTPDYREMVKNGATRETAMTVNMLRAAFPVRPIFVSGLNKDDFVAACELYIKGLRAVQKCCDGKKNQAEISGALKNDPDVKIQLGELGPSRFSSRLVWVFSPEFSKWSKGLMQIGSHINTIDYALRLACSCSLDRTKQRVLERNPEWPEGTSKVDQMVRNANLSFIPIPNSGDPQKWEIARDERAITPDRASYYKDEAWAGMIGRQFDSEDLAREELEEVVSKYNAAKIKKTMDLEKIFLGLREDFTPHRRGPDFRKGIDAEGQHYLDHFTLVGGQFGNWVNIKQRRECLNSGYDAFCDMADALGGDKSQISLNSELAIAFGARGTGGLKAPAAHYEPTYKIFNLTKPHGAGCLAHEYGHGLDHSMGRRAHAIGLPVKLALGIAYLSEAEISETAWQMVLPHHQEEAKMLIKINKTMQDIWTPRESDIIEIARADVEKNKELEKNRLSLSLVSFLMTVRQQAWKKPVTEDRIGLLKEVIEECFRKIYMLDGGGNHKIFIDDAIAAIHDNPELKEFQPTVREYLLTRTQRYAYWSDRAVECAPGHSVTSRQRHSYGKTPYMEKCEEFDNSRKGKKQYYSLKREMFARTFEAMIDDKLRSMERDNSYLVDSTNAEAFPAGKYRERHNAELLPLLGDYVRTMNITKPKDVEKEMQPAVTSEYQFTDKLPPVSTVQRQMNLL